MFMFFLHNYELFVNYDAVFSMIYNLSKSHRFSVSYFRLIRGVVSGGKR